MSDERKRREGVKVVTTLDDTMVTLDFGDYGSIEVSPEMAMSFLSDQKVRDDIRTACTRAHKARQSIARPSALRDEDDED